MDVGPGNDAVMGAGVDTTAAALAEFRNENRPGSLDNRHGIEAAGSSCKGAASLFAGFPSDEDVPHFPSFAHRWRHHAAASAAANRAVPGVQDAKTKVLSGVGPWSSLIVLSVRAVLAVRRNRPGQAIALAGDSLARIHALHDRFAFLYALVSLAAAAELSGDDAWAARIVGVRDAVTERTGATAVDQSVRDLEERVERGSRARLGPRRWSREYEAGRKASVESLLKEVNERVAGARSAPPVSPGGPGPGASRP
jgi:hypothetical protein